MVYGPLSSQYRKNNDIVAVSFNAKTFEQCKTLGWSAGMDNLDSLSLYITGLSFFAISLRDGDLANKRNCRSENFLGYGS